MGGSSPRMWGTRHLRAALDEARRFIPTHVGNTYSASAGMQRRSVHPHACGEHDARPLPDLGHNGSSPRMWGTRWNVKTDGGRCRFIPTHVGNTPPDCGTSRSSTVHPHACGEHATTIRGTQNAAGSSPRMWGTRRQGPL